jgi:broad specificity phosphatase PhoE
MNRLILVRHGGSTGNENQAFYQYNDSALCLTTNGIEQALSTATVLDDIDPTWMKPGNFNLEVFASEYTRAQQTARICLDQMGVLSLRPGINALLNERNYGTAYLNTMDTDPDCTANGSESSHQARPRAGAFIDLAESILPRADVLSFSHMGLMRALIAELMDLSDADMMKTTVDNGRAFLFERSVGSDGVSTYVQRELPAHVLRKSASFIKTVPDPGPPQASHRPCGRDRS